MLGNSDLIATRNSNYLNAERPRQSTGPLLTALNPNYTLNEDPHPQVLFVFGFSNLNPAASSVST
jgi:hypothetical protein